jgi:hypothetical protein
MVQTQLMVESGVIKGSEMVKDAAQSSKIFLKDCGPTHLAKSEAMICGFTVVGTWQFYCLSPDGNNAEIKISGMQCGTEAECSRDQLNLEGEC